MSKSLVELEVRGATACCAPLSGGALSGEQAELIAPLLRALADPVRLRLMSLVASAQGGEACVCDLTGAFDLSQPTISHHLKVLHDAGLLEREKRGVWVYYRARTRALAGLGALIASSPAERPPQEAAAAPGGPSAPGWQGGGGARSGAARGDGNAASRDAGTRELSSPRAGAS